MKLTIVLLTILLISCAQPSPAPFKTKSTQQKAQIAQNIAKETTGSHLINQTYIELTEAHHNKEVLLESGQKFKVSLKSNASTGYQWRVRKIDKGTIILDSSLYFQSTVSAGTNGATGLETFTFRTLKAGRTKLVLHYAREKGSEAANTFNIHIIIR